MPSGYLGITCLMLNCFFHLAVYSLEITATMNTTISCQQKKEERNERTELKKNLFSTTIERIKTSAHESLTVTGLSFVMVRME